MKFVPNGSIIKFLLIAVLSCGLAFLVAWLTTMFTVIKLTQGVSLAGVALILLWCVVIGGAAVWSICAFCALYVGTWRKHHVDHAIRFLLSARPNIVAMPHNFPRLWRKIRCAGVAKAV